MRLLLLDESDAPRRRTRRPPRYGVVGRLGAAGYSARQVKHATASRLRRLLESPDSQGVRLGRKLTPRRLWLITILAG